MIPLDGGAGNDTLKGGTGDDTYHYTGEDGFDIITDTGGTDTIVFKSGYNIKAPWKAPYRDGNNLVYVSENGKSGFTVVDHFSDTNKSIELFHYEGADGGAYSVKVQNSNSAVGDGSYDEALLGTKGDDTLTGVAGTKKRHDEFYGHEGNDTINNASGGKSWIEAGDGNDIITGGAKEDIIRGQNGDTIDGGNGNDIIYGGNGNDTIKTGAGDDKVYGEAGDDIIIQNGSGSQTYDGGSGTDTLKVDTSGGWSTLNNSYPKFIEINSITGIVGQVSNPNLRDTFINIENLTYVGSFDTFLTGNEQNNIILGSVGKDTLDGGAGNDTLKGGTGDDTYHYTGEDGFDIITDTGGTDTIVFKSGYNIKAPWKAPYRDGNNLVYVSENGKSGFTVVDHFSDTNKSIELFHYEGADGGAYSVKVRNSNSAVGDGSYDEALLGTKGDDTLTAGSGYKKTSR